MEDLLQQNLMYLYRHHDDMFEQIQSYMNANQEKNCKIVYGNNGTVNLSYAAADGVKLLYAENEEDIKEWLEENRDLANGYYDIAMYGLGLSHHLAPMIQLNPNLSFYILEPEIDIFIEALKVIQIDQLLNHPQIKLLHLGNEGVDFENFYTLLHTYSEFPIIDVFIPFYTNINLAAMRQYYDYNYTFREVEAIHYGFEGLFGVLPYRNSILNLEKMYNSHSLTTLKNKFLGCTALIVGGGPSLELDIEYIKRNRDRLFIISAGSSIQSLLHFGIEPHLCVSMDPGPANAKVFENLNVDNFSMVYVPQISQGVLNRPFHQTFYSFFNNDPIMNYIFPDLDPQLKMQANNSVSGTAIQVAAYIGASKIMLAGQDLSFPNNQFYSSGAKHTDTGRLNNIVSMSDLVVENVNGSVNSTNRSMQSTLEDIELLIAAIPDVEFINTSSLGAKIKGAEFVPLLEALNGVEIEYNFADLNSVLTLQKSISKFEGVEIMQRIAGAIDTSKQLIKYVDVSLRIIKNIDELSRTNPNKAMNNLAKLEQQFSQVTENRLFKTVIPAWNRGLTKKYDKHVIKIEKEPTMIGKSRLLNEIVVPYMTTIRTSFGAIEQGFQQVYERLQESMIIENR